MSRMHRNSWAKRVVGRRGKDLGRRAANYRRRLSVEQLEDRWLLAVLTVNSDLDFTSPGDGRVTLREAVVAANTDTTTDLNQTGSGADTIVFASSLGGDTILLNGTEIQITAALTIDASSLTENVAIDASGQSRIFNITAVGGNFSFYGLTLTGGATFNNNTASGTTYSGGAIRSLTTGSLTLSGSTVSGSRTEGRLADGGGIFALGDVILIDTAIEGNYTLSDYASGGGVYSGRGVTLSGSAISFNHTEGDNSTGGGLYAYLDVSLTDGSAISNNCAMGNQAPGGGMFVGDDVTVTDSVVSGNYSMGESTSGPNASCGGGIYALGDGTFTGSTISGNHTEGDYAAGGGAWISGNLTVTESTLDGNHTQGDFANGGGLFAGGAITFAGSSATGNYTLGHFARGGAIYGSGNVVLTAVYDDDVVLAASNLSGNHTEGSSAFGGAVFASAAATLEDGMLSSNYTLGGSAQGGAIWANNSVEVNRSVVRNNLTSGDSAYGGGIHTLGDVTLTDSTVSGNHTEGVSAHGGGINAVDAVTVMQSTVSGNYALGNNAQGGGIKAGGATTIIYSTVADNDVTHPSAVGGGVWNGNGPLFIICSIVATNTAVGGNPDLCPGTGTLTVNHSLIGTNAGTSLAEAQTPDGDGNLIGGAAIPDYINPLLGPLSDNGGPSETHALLAGSPAIDAGDPTLEAGQGDVSDYDQRGAYYGRVVNGGLGLWIDMGAFEFGNIAPGSISGQKWDDRNGDGVKDAGEPGLAGWMIYLDLNQNQVFNSDTGTLTLEPDDYPVGTLLNHIVPGVTLSAVGGLTTDVFAGVPAGGRTSTGGLGFISSSVSWVESGPRLRADFTWQVNRVSIDMIANDYLDIGRMDAYDAAGVPLETYFTDPATIGEVKTMEIIRDEPDIAYVIASGSGPDTVNLDNLQFTDSEPFTTTDADGNYLFVPLGPGSYAVREVEQSGWIRTFPTGSGTHLVTVDEGQDVTNIDFGNHALAGSIRGQKWNDLDGDGVRDPGDVGLEGWTIYVDENSNSVWDGAVDEEHYDVTGPDGTYTLSDLAPDSYLVREVQQTGWSRTFPAAPGTYLVAVSAGQDVLNIDFGNHGLPGSINGQKWDDQDGNGMKDDGEDVLAGWTIYLDINDSGVFDSDSGTVTLEPDDYPAGTVLNNIQPGVTLSTVAGTTTNVYAGVPAGEYASTGTLAFISSSVSWLESGPRLRADFTWRVSRVSIDVIGNDAFDTGVLEAWTYDEYGDPVLLETYETDVLTAGEVETMEITRSTPDVAYVIASGSGAHTVNLDNLQFADSEPSVITNASGNYSFSPLEPGNYIVGEVLQPGWSQTFPTGSGLHQVTVGEGQNVTNVNFGNTTAPPSQVLAGDYNVDGSVNAADYSVWRDTLGSTADLRADGSGPTPGMPNGVVDEYDYVFWKANFGNTAPGSGAMLALAPLDESDAAADQSLDSPAITAADVQADSSSSEARSAIVDAQQSMAVPGDVAAQSVADVAPATLPSEAAAGLVLTVSDNGLDAAGPRLSNTPVRDPFVAATSDRALLAWLAAQAGDMDRAPNVAGAETLPNELAASEVDATDEVDAVFDQLGADRVGLVL